jgi:hypothetical protein
MTLYQRIPKEHTTIAKHLTAEKQEEDFVPGQGPRRPLGDDPPGESLSRRGDARPGRGNRAGAATARGNRRAATSPQAIRSSSVRHDDAAGGWASVDDDAVS